MSVKLEPHVHVSVADDQALVSAVFQWVSDQATGPLHRHLVDLRFVGTQGRGRCSFTMPAELLESLRAFLVEQGVARQALLGVEDLCS